MRVLLNSPLRTIPLENGAGLNVVLRKSLNATKAVREHRYAARTQL